MLIKRLMKVSVALLFFGLFAGCGSDGNSNTNGTLTLNATVKDLGNGLSNITAAAAFSKAVPGMKIRFTGKHYRVDGTVIESIPPVEANTDSTGSAAAQFNAGQTSEITFFEVTASTGGLFKAVTLTIDKAPVAP